MKQLWDCIMLFILCLLVGGGCGYVMVIRHTAVPGAFATTATT